MPGLLTHYCFAKHVCKEDDPLILIGTQGPDIFFSYGLTLKHRRKDDPKLVRGYGSLLHRIDISKPYYDFITMAKDHEQRDILSTYIDGLLMHYAFDSIAHAYIFSRSGFSKEKGKWLKYSCAHNYFETLLDKEIMEHFGDKTRPDKSLPLKKREMEIVSSFWAEFNEKEKLQERLPSNGFYCGVEDYRFVTRFLLSKTGIKRFFLRLFGKKRNKLYCYCYPRTTKSGKKYDLLNLNHAEWRNPSTGEVHHEDFFEIIDISYKRYLALKELKDRIMKGEEVYEEFAKVVNKINHDGIPAGTEMKYFNLVYDWGK